MLIRLPLFNDKECTAGGTPFHLCKASPKQPSHPLTNGSCSPSWSLFSSSFFIDLPYCCLSHPCLCFSLFLFFGFYSSACVYMFMLSLLYKNLLCFNFDCFPSLLLDFLRAIWMVSLHVVVTLQLPGYWVPLCMVLNESVRKAYLEESWLITSISFLQKKMSFRVWKTNPSLS